MYSIAQTLKWQRLKCQNRKLKCQTLSQPLRLKCRGLNAVTTRELPNYIDGTVHQ